MVCGFYSPIDLGDCSVFSVYLSLTAVMLFQGFVLSMFKLCVVLCMVMLDVSWCALSNRHGFCLLYSIFFLLLRSLLWCLSFQLKRMYASLSGQLFLQQRVYHSVTGGLWLSLESVRYDDKPEMGLSRDVSLHGLVVGVHVRVVVDIKHGGTEAL